MLLTVLVNTLISLWDTLIQLLSIIKKIWLKLLKRCGLYKDKEEDGKTIGIKPMKTLLDDDDIGSNVNSETGLHTDQLNAARNHHNTRKLIKFNDYQKGFYQMFALDKP
jgi:hypothetical protein